MIVLSLFDGMSGGQQAFERIGITFDGEKNIYFAAEIKKHAIKVAKENYPNTIFIGDVTKVWHSKGVLHTEVGDFKVKIDALIGGSPCQSISNLMAQHGKGSGGIFNGKSDMFFEYYRILNEIKPEYFLLENVNGHKQSLEAMTTLIGVEPININSNLVSFQNRNRWYWTNIPGVEIPEDKHINFQDFKETDTNILKEYKVKKTPSRIRMWEKDCPNVTYREKINCLTCKQDRRSNAGLVEYEDFCRYLTVKECEQAQTVRVGYTSCLTKVQAYDVLGDGWTIDVIAHILKNIETKEIKLVV